MSPSFQAHLRTFGRRTCFVLREVKYSNCNQLTMVIFSTPILAAIKNIRTQKGRPDSDKIFKEIVKESATKFTLENIQQALQHMVSNGKLINIPHKGLDTYYVLDTQSVEFTCDKDINLQKNFTPNGTDSLPSLSISAETPKIDSTKYKSSYSLFYQRDI